MRRCDDDICAFKVCCLWFLLFCEKSLKTLPFLLPFSRKGQTEEKFLHERKELFSLRDDYEYREEYTEEEEEEEERKREKTKRERDRSFVVAETERLKSSDRPRCGTGIKVLHREDILVFECSYFPAFFLFQTRKIHTKNRAKNHLTFLLE
jgi:hypothetical protein